VGADPNTALSVRRKLWAAAFWAAFATVTWLALTPQPPRAIAAISDIVLHAFAFAVLTFLLSLAHFRSTLLWPILLMALYGPSIEVLQGAFFGRAAEFKDFGIDLIGIALGVMLVRIAGERIDRMLGTCLESLGVGRGAGD
jgi:VanZ family protein